MENSARRDKAGIEVTPEMIDAGANALALSFDPSAKICELSSEDLVEVYIAMRRLEPADGAHAEQAIT